VAYYAGVAVGGQPFRERLPAVAPLPGAVDDGETVFEDPVFVRFLEDDIEGAGVVGADTHGKAEDGGEAAIATMLLDGPHGQPVI
jgi:hypothetical protein